MSEASPRRSSVTVGAGLVALGLSAAVYMVFAGRATGPAAFSALAVQWTLIYTVGMGMFVPFEQEIARRVAERRTRSEPVGSVVRRAGRLALLLWLGQVVVVLGTLPWLYSTLYYGSPAIVAGLLLASGGLALQYLQRGTFSGSGQFTPYSRQLVAEGGLRLVGTVALWAAGVEAVAPYALLVGLAPLLSAAAVWAPFARLVTGEGQTVGWRDLARHLGWLLVAAVAAQGLANLGTVAVRVLGEGLPSETTGHFMSGLTVARLPLFAFAAVQAVLLPAMAASLVADTQRAFRRQLTVALACTAALAVTGVAGAALVGPEVLRLLFGPDFDLPRGDLTLLASGTGVYMLALVLQPAAIALGGHRSNAAAWLSGVAVFAAVLATAAPVLTRVEVALLLGAVATVAVLATRVATRARRHDTRGAEVVAP